MKIALIICPPWATETPPYNIALMAAVLRKEGYTVKCYDFNIEFCDYYKNSSQADYWLDDERRSRWFNIDYVVSFVESNQPFIDSLTERVLDSGAPVIGFTVYSISKVFTDEIAKRIKKRDPGRIIIYGGPECFKNWQGLGIFKDSPWVDAICLGEAEMSLPRLLDMIEKNGRLESCSGFAYRGMNNDITDGGECPLVEDLDNLPFADYSDFNMDRYPRNKLSISTSRGCIRRCAFCNESEHWQRYRFRHADNIYREIIYQLDRHPSVMNFWFSDSLINGNIKVLEELCELIIDNNLHITWGGQATIREEMTKELLGKMRHAGCVMLNYGLESGSTRILSMMKKGYTAETAERVIRDTYNSGLDCTLNIIVGFPGEEDSEFQETADFIKRNIKYSQHVPINPLFVQKGSEIYRNREKWGVEFIPDRDSDVFWITADKKNNYEERMRRVSICKDLAGDKAVTDIEKFFANRKAVRQTVR